MQIGTSIRKRFLKDSRIILEEPVTSPKNEHNHDITLGKHI